MKENNSNNKAKLLTVGIAVVLILVVCGISLIVFAINKKEKEDTGSKLQSDIIEYANNTQEQSVTTEDIIKEPEEQKKDSEEPAAEKEPEKKEEPAVVVEEEKNKTSGTIMEETAEEQAAGKKEKQGAAAEGNTAVWQKEVSENLATVEIDLSRQMSEMKGYWEAGNMEAVEDLAYLPRYRAASEKLTGTAKYYYFGDTDENSRPNGMGLALYTDNQYYYGEWAGGVRSGNGMWIKYYVYDQNAKAKDSLYIQHSYSGGWSNDLPNGEGAEHYDFINENMEADVGYNRNFIGTFRNGLYDGDIYITNYYKDDNVREWNGTAKNGVWQPLGKKDKKGQYPVIVDATDPDNYQWMAEKENKENGVDGLISAAK